MHQPSLERLLSRAEKLLDRIDAVLPQPLVAPDWSQARAWRYRKRHGANAWLQPLRHIGVTRFDHLQAIETQKEKLQRNTWQFVHGQMANNVLLTGARGTGKSSLIRACLNEYAELGLRLIEIDKGDLVDLPDIVELILMRPEKFIIFCDDLSFEEGELGYKTLKSILDGSLVAPGQNLLIYATSNRRHLLPEHMTDNLSHSQSGDGELHPGEAVDEKISLSERFGLWLSFYPFNQDQYLAIVAQWLDAFGLDAHTIAMARPQALVWALERSSRSGRVAYQFARDFAGRQGHDIQLDSTGSIAAS